MSKSATPARIVKRAPFSALWSVPPCALLETSLDRLRLPLLQQSPWLWPPQRLPMLNPGREHSMGWASKGPLRRVIPTQFARPRVRTEACRVQAQMRSWDRMQEGRDHHQDCLSGERVLQDSSCVWTTTYRRTRGMTVPSQRGVLWVHPRHPPHCALYSMLEPR